MSDDARPDSVVACEITLNTALTADERRRFQNVATIRRILHESKTIAVVGLSNERQRASHFVATYLQRAGYRVIPVNPKGGTVLGETVYPDLASIPMPVDLVVVFRRGQETVRHGRAGDRGESPADLVSAPDSRDGSGGACRGGGTRRGDRQVHQDGAWEVRRNAGLGGNEHGDREREKGEAMTDKAGLHADSERDAADLARFGYKQELKRALGTFSSFAVAFSYISPSTGIFTLYALGLGFIGPAFFWTWPIVFAGQLLVALNFAELSSHFPVAGSVFQWTKYLAGRTYAWFAGWIYLAAGILTVTAVVVTLPLALIPALNGLGWTMENSLENQRMVAVITLLLITVLNMYGVKLVAIVNNTGVVFEILGMVVFALILVPRTTIRDSGSWTQTGGQAGDVRHVHRRHVHEPVRDLRVRHGLHSRRGDPQSPARSAQGRAGRPSSARS